MRTEPRCDTCDDTGYVSDKFGENETGMVCDVLPSCTAARLNALIARLGSDVPEAKEVAVRVRPWPGVDGQSREHEVGAVGAANRVRVLTGPRPDSDAVLISWRDGRHCSLAEAERMVAELTVACRIAREHGA